MGTTCAGAWIGLAATAVAITVLTPQAKATEAVAGRYVPGAFAGPGAGIVPPIPGFYFDISNVYYHGEASGDVPFGGDSVAIGMEGDIWVTALAALWVPEIDLPGNWTYAVQGALPIGWTGVKAGVGPFDADDDVGGIGDIAFAPVVLGWHNDAMDTFVSTSLTITAPIPNALSRFSLGTKNKTLEYNADGSLTIYVQETSPGKEKETNWLPAPEGDFSLYLRAYWPKTEVVDGTWGPPGVTPLSANR